MLKMKIWNTFVKAALLSLMLSAGSAFSADTPQTAVNINNASIEQLEKMNGIGASKAQAIIEYRLQHGNFAKVDDIVKVKGIGPTFLEKNRAWLSVE